jgi:hypothetical protein
MTERPHVYIMGDDTISTWINPAKVHLRGGVIVWCVRHCLGQQETAEDMPDFVKARFPEAQIQEPFSLGRRTDADVAPVKMGWAIVPPATDPPKQ